MRVHIMRPDMSLAQADILEYYLMAKPFVASVKVYDRTGDAVIVYTGARSDEDKAAFIKAEHEAGRRVVMIGDGVNDSPALSEADAGIAISSGAAIAREIADITISADDLYCLLTLKRVSDGMMKRIDRNYRTIIGFNSLLMLLGAAGMIAPTTSALLHNSSTIAIALSSMRGCLGGDGDV